MKWLTDQKMHHMFDPVLLNDPAVGELKEDEAKPEVQVSSLNTSAVMFIHGHNQFYSSPI